MPVKPKDAPRCFCGKGGNFCWCVAAGPIKVRALTDEQIREIAERSRAARVKAQEEIDRMMRGIWS